MRLLLTRVGDAFVNNSADGLFGDPSNAHYIGDVMSVFLSCPGDKIYVGSKSPSNRSSLIANRKPSLTIN